MAELFGLVHPDRSKQIGDRVASHDRMWSTEAVNCLRAFVVAQRVINRGDKVARVNGIVLETGGDVVAAAADFTTLKYTSSQYVSVHEWPMIAAGRCVAVQRGGATEFRGPHDERFFEHPTHGKVFQ